MLAHAQDVHSKARSQFHSTFDRLVKDVSGGDGNDAADHGDGNPLELMIQGALVATCKELEERATAREDRPREANKATRDSAWIARVTKRAQAAMRKQQREIERCANGQEERSDADDRSDSDSDSDGDGDDSDDNHDNVGEEDAGDIANGMCSSVQPMDTTAVDFRSVIGQVSALHSIRQNLMMPVLKPELFPVRAKGLLMVGPPGVGKTYVARATVTELNKALSTVGKRVVYYAPDTSQFRDKYVGEGERKIRLLVECAAREACRHGPDVTSVIFVDEVDALVRKREAHERSGGEAGGGSGNGTLTMLLTTMDGMNEKRNLIWLFATNHEDLLDPAFLRRVQRIPFTPATADDRAKIFVMELARRMRQRLHGARLALLRARPELANELPPLASTAVTPMDHLVELQLLHDLPTRWEDVLPLVTKYIRRFPKATSRQIATSCVAALEKGCASRFHHDLMFTFDCSPTVVRHTTPTLAVLQRCASGCSPGRRRHDECRSR